MNDSAEFRYYEDKLGFFIAANDQDILTQVNRYMDKSGMVGVVDTAGRIHYLVDGRKGPPFAFRRILDATDKLLLADRKTSARIEQQLPEIVNQILKRHHIRPELKGYRYLRYLLLAAGTDESQLRPISKTLYPATAKHYRVPITQVERDIRYALQGTDLRQKQMKTTASICFMYEEMITMASDITKQTNPPIAEI